MRRPAASGRVKTSTTEVIAIATTQTHTPATAELAHAGRHAAWFAVGNVVAFALPFVGVSLLRLQHDVYYGLYFAAVLVLLGAYAHFEQADLRGLFTRNWVWSCALGAVTAFAVVRNVLANSSATPRPHGGYLVFELVWRGAGYGAIDALLLTAFPCAVAYTLLSGRVGGIAGHLRFAALTLPLILAITATYHLGYPQYRTDGVRQPETGNTLMSVPTLVTANPIGSIGAHMSMHIAAVTHAYETDTYLPPQTFVGSK
jgi:hypothetical protein